MKENTDGGSSVSFFKKVLDFTQSRGVKALQRFFFNLVGE
jgi:hypothetical protein